MYLNLVSILEIIFMARLLKAVKEQKRKKRNIGLKSQFLLKNALSDARVQISKPNCEFRMLSCINLSCYGLGVSVFISFYVKGF